MASTGSVAPWVLNQEARALLTRLDRIKPFALHETMVPAANLAPPAQTAIERALIGGRHDLRGRVLGYLRWLSGPGRRSDPAEMQRRFTTIRMQFNNVLSQFDLFTEVVTQRSETENGVWMSGLDELAADALTLPTPFFSPPPVVCYLARGPGAAIRRAKTRLPGGMANPVAIIRVPRERMVGHSIGSSLVHEVGHQGAALLCLVESLRPAIQRIEGRVRRAEAMAWRAYRNWISEIVADFWSVGKLGIGSTFGLMGVVSLPRFFVFRPSGDDPHPIPWIRVRLSCAIGKALYPHEQWDDLASLWASLYPPTGLPNDRLQALGALEATMPAFVELLASHRPAALRGLALADIMPLAERRPEQLVALFETWRRRPSTMALVAPTLAFAALGQARATGQLSPETESRIVGNLLTHWALRSTLDMAAICAERNAAFASARAS